MSLTTESLKCAVKAIAGFAVTSDKHLLNLKNYKGIKIVKLASLLEIIKSPQSDLNG
jgi:predicted nucleic acid-binding protein